jgi:hypothetical protein
MVQGASGHGGEVAGPIATRILERIVAQDQGKFDMQVAWLEPAHHPNPLALVKSVSYAGSNVDGEDEEGADASSSTAAQMAADGGAPDVEPEADDQGRVAKKVRAPRAVAVAAPPVRKPNFFERLFGGNRPTPSPTPVRHR